MHHASYNHNTITLRRVGRLSIIRRKTPTKASRLFKWPPLIIVVKHSIQAWDNDCLSNKVIEEQPDQRHIPPSKLEQYCLDCWPDLITYRYLPQRLNSHQRRMPHGTLNSSARVAYRAHG